MHIKKEWIFQFVVFIIFYLDSVIDVEQEGLSFSDTPGIDLIFAIYEVMLFIIVNYILLPKYFYTKKYLSFAISLIVVIIIFGIGEEGVVEKWLFPRSRGANDVTWQSIYWFFGEVLIPLLAFMSIKLMFDNFHQRHQLEKIEQNRLTNELRLLKSQIQPHILFNSLNNLYHFALEKADEVPELILKLSNVLRYVLYEATDEKVPLMKELDFIVDYVNLQEVQYRGRGVIAYNIPKVNEEVELRIAPFLLIPFIENGFKHSFGSKIKDVVLDLKIEIIQGQLKLYIKNNYEKNDGNSNELTHSGIGLVNVRKRLELLYTDKYHLDTRVTETEYIVELCIKLD